MTLSQRSVQILKQGPSSCLTLIDASRSCLNQDQGDAIMKCRRGGEGSSLVYGHADLGLIHACVPARTMLMHFFCLLMPCFGALHLFTDDLQSVIQDMTCTVQCVQQANCSAS